MNNPYKQGTPRHDAWGRGYSAKSKYRAKPTTIDGIRFASKLEGKRYSELKLLERTGKITGLRRQRPYQLHAACGGQHIGDYKPDFEYWEDGVGVVEDAKGYDTALGKWKIKHFEAEYGVKVVIVRK